MHTATIEYDILEEYTMDACLARIVLWRSDADN